jgi:hypothetical protein
MLRSGHMAEPGNDRSLAAPCPIPRTTAAPLPWDWVAFSAVSVGVLFHVSFQLQGQFFAGELLLLALTPLLVFDRFYRQRDLLRAHQATLWSPTNALLIALAVTFFGYFASDLYRNNAPQDFLRGWARLVFLGITLLGVAMLVSVRRANFWLLLMGYGLGGILVLLLRQLPFSMWKLGYAEPATAAVVAVVCLMRSPGWQGAVLILLGLVNIWLDYRSMAAFVVLVAMVLWLNRWSQRGGVRLVGVLMVTLLAVGIFGGAYYATQGQFSDRRQGSNSGRLSNAIVGFSAILESPLIGYGSWGRDTRFAKLYAAVNARMQKTEESALYDFDAIRQATIVAHSQFLEAWIEGGVLGIVFFLVYLFWLLKGLHALIFRVREVTLLPLLAFCMVSGLWALFMSPFKGLTRFTIVFACMAAVIACQLAREASDQEATGHRRGDAT